MKTTRTAKGERRAHRNARDGRRLEHEMPVRAIDAALERFQTLLNANR